MTLDVNFDEDAEQVNVVMDDHLLLQAHVNDKRKIVFSKNFSKIEDEHIQEILTSFCTKLLSIEQ